MTSFVSIDQRIAEATARAREARANREEFERVQKFVREAREKGLVVDRKYDLPLVDTIGNTAYRDRKLG